MPRATAMRFGLRWYLLAVALLGAGGGMAVRHVLSRPETGKMRDMTLDGHRVYAAWVQRWGRSDQLMYVLIVPSGDVVISSGVGPLSVSVTDDPDERVAQIGLSAAGFTLDGDPVPGSGEGRLWLFRPTTRKIEEVPWPASRDPVRERTADAFGAWGDTYAWKDTLKPLADQESKDFRQLGVERILRKARSRVPPPADKNSSIE